MTLIEIEIGCNRLTVTGLCAADKYLNFDASKVFYFGSKNARLMPMKTLSTIPSIETPNLILREIETPDSTDLACFMTQARYQRHIAHKLKDMDEVREFVRRQVAVQNDSHRRVYHLAAEERLSTEVVGDGFLISHQDNSLEMGWGLHPALWSMGFGTEIGRALLGAGFEKLHAKTMWCKIMSANGASKKLAKRIGMVHSKTHLDYPVGQGRFEPVDIYTMSADQYFDLPY
jgi:[ribosomal protein S5]-alanine N-acetyltransferase